MTTIKEVLDFWNEFTFHDQYNIETLIELNHVRHCVISVLSECHFISPDQFIRALGVIGDISLMIIDGNVEKLVQEINKLKVDFIQIHCLEILYREEKDNKKDLLL